MSEELPELPPLPKPDITQQRISAFEPTSQKPYFTAETMQGYALAFARSAVMAERERCAKLCWERSKNAPEAMAAEAMLCAAAIRGLTKE